VWFITEDTDPLRGAFNFSSFRVPALISVVPSDTVLENDFGGSEE
jgi:hypothetical protein